MILGACLLACAGAPPAPPPSTPPPAAAPSVAAPAVAPGAAEHAEPPPIFRLPADVRPTRERVELEVVPDRPTFRGTVQVELVLAQPRSDLWISARGLSLGAGTLTAGDETVPVRFEPDDVRGAARVVLPHPLPAGPAMLQIAFEGSFNPRLAGLYRVKSRDRWYAFTQFEAVDARRAFPCFDEPAMKIPWELTLVVPGQAVAVANAPELDRAAAGWAGSGPG